MKKEIADLWIADLRSNPPQARKKLFDGEGYCCLGRLCLLAGKTFVHNEFGRYVIDDEWAILPRSVRDWAGMQSGSGIYNSLGDLTSDNDEGKTFAQIADIIEANWEKM